MPEPETIALDSSLTTANTEEVVERNSNLVNDENKPKIQELDKFKRRLIRAIARLTLVEKKPEEEIWTELKKETNCDCKLLWYVGELYDVEFYFFYVNTTRSANKR